MISLLKRIVDAIFGGSKYTSNEVAADYIRRFVRGDLPDSYDWDAFETITEDNPDVNLALNLFWHFANKYQERHRYEYCSEEAFPYLLIIAEALETNLFSALDHDEVIEYLKENNELPDSIKSIFEKTDPQEN
jgi:regulator of protease activity HflC (stomatin/prohibitin superfamily)